jgi:hypothetical protein
VNFKGYLPIGATGLAPYAFIGYTHGFDQDTPESHPNENRMNGGAGFEYCLGERVKLFADGRWTHNFSTIGHMLFRMGGGMTF